MGHFFLTTISTLTLFAMPALAVVIDFEAQAGFYGSTTPSSEFAGIVFDRDVQVLAGTSVAARPGQSGQVARAAIPPFGGLPRGGAQQATVMAHWSVLHSSATIDTNLGEN